jgi:hypothetical protein
MIVPAARAAHQRIGRGTSHATMYQETAAFGPPIGFTIIFRSG